MSNQIRKFLYETEDLPRNGRLFIWGAGDIGRKLLARLREKGGYNMIAFVDSFKTGQVEGLEVISPADLPGRWQAGDHMVVTTLHLGSLDPLLSASGITSYFVCLPPVLSEGPRIGFLTLEVSTNCNLHCTGCSRTIGVSKGTWTNADLSATAFARIIDNLPRVAIMTLHGVGEPTLNRDFPEIVSIAKRSGKINQINTITNGVTRGFDYFKELVDLGLDFLSVSVDSLDPVIANQSRAGTRTEKLERNLLDFRRLGIPLNISCVVSRFNIDNIPSLIRRIDQIGGYSLSLQPYQDMGNDSGCLNSEELASLRRLVEDTVPLLRNITLHLNNSLNPTITAPLCGSPWTDPGITVAGFLTPCCVTWDPARLGHLNLVDVDYATAWRSSSFQNFLHAYFDRDPDFCAGCTMNVRERLKAAS